MESTSRGQQPDQRREHCPVRPGQTWPAHLATQHRHLVTEHEDFRVLRPRVPD